MKLKILWDKKSRPGYGPESPVGASDSNPVP